MKNKVVFLIIVVGLGILARYSIRKYVRTSFENVVAEYMQIDTWLTAKQFFERDRSNSSLKYFYYGLEYNKDFDSIINKYKLDVYFMGDLIDNRLPKYNYFVEKEIIGIHGNSFLSVKDSIWQEFEIALELHNVEFLIENSFDSIFCSELQIPERTINDLYEKEFIFNNHLPALKHLNNLSTHSKTIYIDENKLRVIFNIESKQAEEIGYDLIFLFDKKDGVYLFEGMILT